MTTGLQLPLLPDRLADSIQHRDDGCWQWMGPVNPKGYGLVYGVLPAERYAHRVVYLLLRGPVPIGQTLDHLCRRPGCDNPDHLQVVSRSENSLRAVNARRSGRRNGVRNGVRNALPTPLPAARCRACEYLLDPTLVALGYLIHPTCGPQDSAVASEAS
jgi:hypothetical protein